MAALAGQGFAQPTSPPVWLQSFEMEVRTRMLWTDTSRVPKWAERQVLWGLACSVPLYSSDAVLC